MPSVNTVSISSLGLASDGKYHINGIENPIYLIDINCDIVVEEDSIVVLLDTLLESKVNVLGLKNSLINYYVLNSKCSKRSFDINGEINYLEIAIGDINEALNVNLLNENSKVLAKVLSIADKANAQFVERIDHKVKNTESNITNVGVSMNSAGIVFDTTGKIDKGMSGSKCSQLSRGIVMDDDSFITAKPILLIDEFDCFANHGASIGKMSDEDLFYLMSRGLSKNDAFLLILKGIIKPYVDALPLDELKDKILEKITILIEK